VRDIVRRLEDKHSTASVGPSPPKAEALELILGCFWPALDDDDEEDEEGGDDDEDEVELMHGDGRAASGAGQDSTPPRAAAPRLEGSAAAKVDQPAEAVAFADVFTRQVGSPSAPVRALSVEDVTLAVDHLRERKLLDLADGGNTLRLLRPDVMLDVDAM